jgi:hypothetical protein
MGWHGHCGLDQKGYRYKVTLLKKRGVYEEN